MKKCKVKGCNNISRSKTGYCNRHRGQIYYHGKIAERTVYDPNEFIIEGDICKIKLYNRNCDEIAEAIIDAEDYEKCKGMKWRMHSGGYAVSGSVSAKIDRYITLQHLIFGSKVLLDHIDGNKLINKKNNLRICTIAENNRNYKKPKNNTSGYKGVSWHKVLKKWMGCIYLNNKPIHLGYFIDKIQAAIAYNEAAIKYHGEFAKLNEITIN